MKNSVIKYSIHQPSAEVYAMFDTLYLLSNRHPAQAKDYFASVSHVCPTYIIPSDNFITNANTGPTSDSSNVYIFVLCHRNVARLLRDKMAFRAKVTQNLFVSVIVGLIY
ncbi:hypothetical protein THRCLA_22290, partial [Thraustotheca clavata]